MNKATRLAKQRMADARLRDQEERELAAIEEEGSAHLSDKSKKQSVGGMLGGLGGSMLLKYLASAALTAATGGAAGPAMMAMLTAASHAAPAVGSALGSGIGGSLNASRASDARLRELAHNTKSRGLVGAGADTANQIGDQLGAQGLKGALKAGVATALTGGTADYINAAKDAGMQQLASNVAAGTSRIKDVGELAKYANTLKDAKSYGLMDALGAGKNYMGGLLGKSSTLADKTGLPGWQKMYEKGIQGVTDALPEDLEAYKQFQEGLGGSNLPYNEWFQEYMNQTPEYFNQTYQ
jgi:hypothetical protein